MKRFAFSHEAASGEAVRRIVVDNASGAYVAFEGWVRNHNEGQRVLRLEYEAYESLGAKEGERIIREAEERFGIGTVYCVHRLGQLEIGDIAVIVGVSTPHRGEAFEACRYIIDEVKHRVPIWKKEYYENGDSGWVNCERCSAAAHDHD
jgi:molybdopterin synthase catalytic subunit